MKKSSVSLLSQISAAHLENLTNIVEETLATELNSSKAKVFTAADLWSIQRQSRRFIQRRYSL